MVYFVFFFCTDRDVVKSFGSRNGWKARGVQSPSDVFTCEHQKPFRTLWSSAGRWFQNAFFKSCDRQVMPRLFAQLNNLFSDADFCLTCLGICLAWLQLTPRSRCWVQVVSAKLKDLLACEWLQLTRIMWQIVNRFQMKQKESHLERMRRSRVNSVRAARLLRVSLPFDFVSLIW